MMVFTQAQKEQYHNYSCNNGLDVLGLRLDGSTPANWVVSERLKEDQNFSCLFDLFATLPVIDWVAPYVPPEEESRVANNNQ